MPTQPLAAPDAIAQIIAIVESVDDKPRVLRTVMSYFESAQLVPPLSVTHVALPEGGRYSSEQLQSPKQFMFDKKPTTDVERIACLAYYLTHFRDQAHFKTVDLTRLNTEAAQLRFSNAALAANNALKRGYLAHATKGTKQLSASGEQYVQALPDRAAAAELMLASRKRLKAKTKRNSVRSLGGGE